MGQNHQYYWHLSQKCSNSSYNNSGTNPIALLMQFCFPFNLNYFGHAYIWGCIPPINPKMESTGEFGTEAPEEADYKLACFRCSAVQPTEYTCKSTWPLHYGISLAWTSASLRNLISMTLFDICSLNSFKVQELLFKLGKYEWNKYLKYLEGTKYAYTGHA